MQKDIERIGEYISVVDGSAKSNSFYIDYEKSDFFNHEKVYLNKENGPFLQMKFMEIESTCRGFYDCTGFVTFREYLNQVGSTELGIEDRFINGEKFFSELLLGIKKYLIGVDESENYLLFFDRYTLCLSTLYINRNGGETKFAYIPTKTLFSKNEKIMELLNEVEKEFPRMDVSLFVKKIKMYIGLENPSLKGLVNFIGKNI